ncbi:hypothetical protein HGRIS_013962 [Hohenbuehelia grisea]|uniref:Uncharacterized protein n=1 Tax=Hohenbuehelia grisea TaxID=104357 RepID=A0ABR3JRZ2_9AGAR
MDVWVEFKNTSKRQAEALFRNFFPCSEGPAPWTEVNENDVTRTGEEGQAKPSVDGPLPAKLVEDDEESKAIILGDIEVRALDDSSRPGDPTISTEPQQPNSPSSSTASFLWT